MKNTIPLLVLIPFLTPFLHAQPLKVDFNAVDATGVIVAGSANQEGFEPFNMQHETVGGAFDVIRTETFSTAWGNLDITTSTDADTGAENVNTVYQAIARDDTFVPDYDGTLLELARDWTGLDSRSAGATTYSITISGLPDGSYDFLSYHQDIQNQTGQFDVLVDGNLVHSNVDIWDSSSGQNPGPGNPPHFIITSFDVSGGAEVTISFQLTSGGGSVAEAFFVFNGFVLAEQGEATLVESFAADVTTAFAGQNIELSWNVSPGSTVTIDQGIGDVTGMTTDGTGSTTVQVSADTTFTLTAEKDGNSETRAVSVTIQSDIVSFIADPTNVPEGSPTTLSWEANPDATLSIEPAVGDVGANTVDGLGSIEVSPAETTMYTLTADRDGTMSTATATVTVVAGTGETTLGEGLVAYWPLDELNGTKTPELVGGMDMEASNFTQEKIVEGRFGNAFSFVNADQTILSRVHENDDELPANKHESFTISFWAKVNGVGQSDLRMFSEGSTQDNNPLFNIGTHNGGANGSVDIFIRNGDTEVNHAQSQAQPLDGVDWHHIVFVEEQGQRSLYIDGALDPVVLAPRATAEFPVNNTTIGGILRASTCCLVTGLIDEVAIWKRALSDDEIVELNVNNLGGVFPPVTRGLVAHWPLDELQGTKTPDLVNGLDMDVSNMTAENVVEGKNGNAFEFKNEDQTLLSRVHGANDPLPANKHESFTVSFWAKVNGVGQNDLRMFSEGSTEDNNPLFNIGTHNGGANGSVDIFIRNGDTEVNHAQSQAQPLDGVDWHHIVFVEEQGQRSLYIDGVLDPVALAPRATPEFPVNNTTIGGILRASTCCLVSGFIDDVAIWKRALTPEEIVEINVNGVPEVLRPQLPLEIRRFIADFPAVERGGSVVLRWDVSQDATVEINQGIGDVTDLTLFGVGQLEVTVESPTVYELTIRRGDEELTRQVAVDVVDGVAEGWNLLDNFEAHPTGGINGQGGWKAPDGNADVVNLGINKVLAYSDGELVSALELRSQSIPEGENATVFMRAYLSPSESSAAKTLHFGLTERPIRFVDDFNDNVGPFIRLEKAEGAGSPVELLARDGIGAAFTPSGFNMEFGVVYNLWFDIENRPVAEGDIYSVYIQAEGDTERTLLFDGFLADRSPEVDPFFGPPLPELRSLFFTFFETGQGTDFLLFDDMFISMGAFNETIPIAASSFEFVEPSLDIIVSGAMDVNGFTITWNSEIGDTYAVEATGDFSAWNRLVEGYPEGGAPSSITSYTDPDMGPDHRYYRVVFEPPPALLSEDFESGAAGWTVEKPGTSPTTWELGIPTNGPGEAHSGENVYGTDLDADYELNTETLLISPVIDLTGETSATLVFWHFLDVEGPIDGTLFDFGEVNILGADNSRLVESVYKAGGTTAAWRRIEVALPEEVMGQQIRLEFRMVGDDFQPDGPQSGWFIDDVVVQP